MNIIKKKFKKIKKLFEGESNVMFIPTHSIFDGRKKVQLNYLKYYDIFMNRREKET